MNDKTYRQVLIKEFLATQDIGSQDELINLLLKKGISITQATLSRDIREMKVSKVPNSQGLYVYKLTDSEENNIKLTDLGFLGIEFSGNLAVIKTRPGYAMGIAYEIDGSSAEEFLGTVAGDDTILLIIKENIQRKDVLKALSKLIPNIKDFNYE